MQKTRKKLTVLHILAITVAVLFILILLLDKPKEQPEEATPTQPVETTQPAETEDPYALAHSPWDRLAVFARLNNLSLEEDWPERMQELLMNNPDAAEYVIQYPLRKGTCEEADLSALVGTGKVPQLYQWDMRWGYSKYGDKEMGLTGCGPTCLSMVCLYYFEDAKYTPRYVADFAQDNGYYTKGVGTEWALMHKGASTLGLNVGTLAPNAKSILSQLKKGNLVICAMGPGDFTESGHFILLAGVQDGKAIVHDPNSPTNTAKLWDVESFRDQIQNLWVYKPIA